MDLAIGPNHLAEFVSRAFLASKQAKSDVDVHVTDSMYVIISCTIRKWSKVDSWITLLCKYALGCKPLAAFNPVHLVSKLSVHPRERHHTRVFGSVFH